MIYREALTADIQQIQLVRNAVKENTLSDPGLVTDKDCEEYITFRGKGWVCELDGQVIGFAIADLKENNVWALFIRPEDAGKGIGKHLHHLMLDWYFKQTRDTLWLGTGIDTKAVDFYRKRGWTETGMHGSKELKFEMTFEDWKALSH